MTHALEPFIGIPYVDLGRDRAGLDCYGLVRLVLRELRGVELPAYDGTYAGGDDVRGVARTVRAGLPRDWCRLEAPEPLALVMFRGGHVGLCVDRVRFLHSDRPGLTSRIERLASPLWQPRIEGFYRHAA